jgi:urease accessory protein
MDRDAAVVRQGRPVIFSSLREDPQATAVTAWVLGGLAEAAGAAVASASGS